jgi:hypothetical protein
MADVFERTAEYRAANTVLHLRRQVDRAEAERGRDLSINERATLERAIANAKPAYDALSLPTLRAEANETAFRYRRRVVEDLKGHHPQWRKSNPGRITDPEGFAAIEAQVLAAATRNGLDPTYLGLHVLRGQLRERKVVDASDNESTVFHGDPRDCWGAFSGPVRVAVTQFQEPSGRRLYPK